MPVQFDTGESKIVRVNFYRVDPREVVMSDEANTRAFPVSEAAVAEMAESFRRLGQLQPCPCRKLPDRRIAIVGGVTRLKAALRLRAENPEWMLKVTVDPNLNDEDALLASIEENNRRNQVNLVDHAHNIHRLIDRFGWDTDRIMAFYGWSRTKVGEVRRIKGLPVKVQRAIADGKVKLAPALMMAGLDDAAIDELLADHTDHAAKAGEPRETLFPSLAPLAGEEGESATQDEDGEAPKPKRGRPAKSTSSRPAKRAVKAADVAARLRDGGVTVKRTLSDLKRVLDGRSDPISAAILGFLAGEVPADDLTAVLDDAEPIIPAETIYDPAMAVADGNGLDAI